ncbi:hypothetical protein BDV98DRAFT_596543 [Pterulicium gracile]|uniref:Uncharacterized protein n=1 Tax=Pterulicium gracile TaxID=1884261 RepID=A0A5C3Q7L3_9AGAR|nr:hypothetical protein BDV98DRAFT_596543 [Pterula gracilis]
MSSQIPSASQGRQKPPERGKDPQTTPTKKTNSASGAKRLFSALSPQEEKPTEPKSSRTSVGEARRTPSLASIRPAISQPVFNAPPTEPTQPQMIQSWEGNQYMQDNNSATPTPYFDEDTHKLLTALGHEVAEAVEKACKTLLKMSAISGSLENPVTSYLTYIPEGALEAIKMCMGISTVYAWQTATDRHSEIGNKFWMLTGFLQPSMEKMHAQTEAQSKAVIEAIKATPATPAIPPATSYAQAATKVALAKAPVHCPQPPREPVVANPLKAHHPSRLVILMKPRLPVDKRPQAHRLVQDISQVLQANNKSKALNLVSAKWNEEGNCILFTRADQKATDLEKVVSGFKHFFNPKNKASITISACPDEKWLSLQIGGVSTGAFNGHMMGGRGVVYTGEQVHNELRRNNPGFAELDFIQAAQWMHHPSKLESTPMSSVCIALRNQDKADRLLRQRVLHAFGRQVTVRIYASRKPFAQC